MEKVPRYAARQSTIRDSEVHNGRRVAYEESDDTRRSIADTR